MVIAVKGQSLPGVAPHIKPLLEPHTLVLPAMNGVPWWFGRGVPALEGAPLASVDPGGVVSEAIPFDQVIGCVVHASTWTSEPGLVEHKTGQGLIVGEPAGGESDRVHRLGDALKQAGFEVTQSADVRRDIWYKLWGNMTMNPVSAVTGAHAAIGARPIRWCVAFCSAAMREASAVGAKIGCAIDQQPEDRHVITRKLGSFKPSMLQDVEAGRTLELDAIVSVVREIAGASTSPRRTSTRCSASRGCSRASAGCIRRSGTTRGARDSAPIKARAHRHLARALRDPAHAPRPHRPAPTPTTGCSCCWRAPAKGSSASIWTADAPSSTVRPR